MYTTILCLLLIAGFFLQLLNIIPLELVILDTQKVSSFTLTTAFTSLFFHASLLHFILNLIALFLFSRKVEEELGAGVLLLFIGMGTLANIVASFYAGFTNSHYLSIGASAGIAPLLFMAIIAKPFSLLTPFAYFIILFDLFNLTNQNTQVNHLVHFIGYLTSFIVIGIIGFKRKKMIYISIFFNLAMLTIIYIALEFYFDNIINTIL